VSNQRWPADSEFYQAPGSYNCDCVAKGEEANGIVQAKAAKCEICAYATQTGDTATQRVTLEPDSFLELGSTTGAFAGSISGVVFAATFVFFVGKE
ncbi:MAG: hypothetical protein ACPGR8_10795, partial [Limisphaerales bacterium]